MENIQISAEFKKALFIINKTSKNLFLTWKAGTGKSTLLSYLQKNKPKAMIVIAGIEKMAKFLSQ